MGGFFGVVAKDDCVADLFYGTDYHSHLGTRRGGLAVAQRRRASPASSTTSATPSSAPSSRTTSRKLHGTLGIGVISDYEDQPLIIGSHLGTYAIVTVGRHAERRRAGPDRPSASAPRISPR